MGFICRYGLNDEDVDFFVTLGDAYNDGRISLIQKDKNTMIHLLKKMLPVQQTYSL